jgi:cytochrome P450/NADPH-cytochrome P450 reductase
MKGYLDPMIDIAEQLCLKWERLNPDEPIDVTADMTRLTLDTIALCGFSYRFNSFYRDTQHPFIEAMMGALARDPGPQRLLPVAVKMRRGAQAKLLADSKLMDDTVATILEERKASGDPGNDLLGHMLVGTDKAGNALPDHNIVAQCVTFLVAGHETTSGLLSFTIAYLLKHPEVVARAHEEIDRVLGTDPSFRPPSRRSSSSATSGRSSTRRCGSGRRRPRSPGRPGRPRRSAGGGRSPPASRSSH